MPKQSLTLADLPDTGLGEPQRSPEGANERKTGWQGKVKLLSRVRLFLTPWTVAYHTPLSMGFFQARALEWVAISFSRGSSRPRDRTQVSCIVGRHFTI